MADSASAWFRFFCFMLLRLDVILIRFKARQEKRVCFIKRIKYAAGRIVTIEVVSIGVKFIRRIKNLLHSALRFIRSK